MIALSENCYPIFQELLTSWLTPCLPISETLKHCRRIDPSRLEQVHHLVSDKENAIRTKKELEMFHNACKLWGTNFQKVGDNAF